MAEDRGSNAILWFLAGLGLGSLLGVLFAPSGGADEVREYVGNRARQAREQASEWVDRGREILERQREEFGSAREADYDEPTAEAGTHGTGEPPPD